MKKALIIEDDFYIRQMYTQSFLNAQYEIHEATNGSEAIKNLEENKYDLILLDIMLPGVDGMEILKAIRFENSKNNKSVVFVMTNNDDPAVKKEAIENGADRHFVKANVTPSEVIKTAREILS